MASELKADKLKLLILGLSQHMPQDNPVYIQKGDDMFPVFNGYYMATGGRHLLRGVTVTRKGSSVIMNTIVDMNGPVLIIMEDADV
jgi:hypothetical protein